LDMAFLTIELNARIKPEHAYAYVLNPYPGTDIYRYAINRGELRNGFSFDDLSGHGTLSLDSLFKDSNRGIVNKEIFQIINLRYFFSFLVLHPRFKPVVKLLIRFPNNRFFILFWQIYENKLLWRYADWNKRKKIFSNVFKMIFH